jgi:cyclopropane-fatty-acyl-phospholipid synthase
MSGLMMGMGNGRLPMHCPADVGSTMFFEKRFMNAIEQIRSQASVPLRIELWNGKRFDFCGEPNVTVTIPGPSALRYFIAPNMNSLGEAFVEGHIKVQGTPKNVFQVAEGLARSVSARLPWAFQWLANHSRDRDRAAIEYHYDVSNDFYALFLDSGMVYSCAYYRSEADTLEVAQMQKIDHILNKLRLAPGESFLDIGCGWGALIMRAVQRYGAVATGITLSKNQFDRASEQICRAGLQDRCKVLLCDYRDLDEAGAYDKIASVGMFEHVGLKNLNGYFQTIHRLLKADGLALNHGITSSDVQSRWIGMGAGEFIDRYVFPDGELPHVSLALKEMARANLEVLDLESLRRHYARTCEAWSDNLEAHSEEAMRIAGPRRYRIWQIYLAGCAHGFSRGWMNLYQVLCCKAESVALGQHPLTRDYMYAGIA